MGRYRAAARKYLKSLRYLDFLNQYISAIENAAERDHCEYLQITLADKLS